MQDLPNWHIEQLQHHGFTVQEVVCVCYENGTGGPIRTVVGRMVSDPDDDVDDYVIVYSNEELRQGRVVQQHINRRFIIEIAVHYAEPEENDSEQE